MDTITREHRIRLALFGACRLPELGSRIKEYSHSNLIWAEKVLTDKEKKLLKVPLWTLSGYGSGSGDGNGDGYGSGSGYGDGDGSGYGDGYGSGSGDGNGDGYGSGSGYGDGDGSGDGSGGNNLFAEAIK